MRLTIKYSKIIEQLSENARATASQIAKRTGVSKEVVNYAIHSLQNQNVITKFITLIDTQKLGYTIYEIYLKLQSNKEEKAIIAHLKENPSCIWVRSALGEWDIITEFYAKNAQEYELIIRDLNNKFGKSIKRIDSSVILKEHSFPLKVLGTNEEYTPSIKTPQTIKLDSKDYTILNSLAENARINVTEIAKKINLSPDATTYRIRNLVKNGVIHGYRTIVNETSLGYTKYKLIIKLKGLEAKTKTTLLTYLKKHNSTQYIKLCIGSWDLSITLLAKNVTELRNIVNDIKTHLADALDEYSLLILLEEYKSTYFPKVLLKQAKNLNTISTS